MKTFSSQKLIDDLTRITDENINKIQSKFMHFSDVQKSWRPNEHTWSLLEIFAHLNEYANYYHEAITSKIEKTKFTNSKENFVSSPLGRSAWKSMKLGNAKNVKRKFKAPKGYNPSLEPQLVKGNDIDEFINNQQQLKSILQQAENVNLKKVKIPIFISRIVRLRLGDALMFCIYHNERHVEQALRLIAHPAFPKKK